MDTTAHSHQYSLRPHAFQPGGRNGLYVIGDQTGEDESWRFLDYTGLAFTMGKLRFMPTLSVIMIVKNEAACLRTCLDSLCGIADELVVADTGSEDETRAIARAAGAKVIEIPWEKDFAKARNLGMVSATGDWLLQIDADEALDADGALRIRALADADGEGVDAIEVIQANYCNDPRAWRWTPVAPGDPYARGYAGYLRVEIIRLFRNRRGYEYREAIHENVTESILERNGRIGHADVIIHHYGYDASSARSAEKARAYLDICRNKAQNRPESLKAWRDLAEQARACGEEGEAERACRTALEIDPLHLDCASALGGLLLSQARYTEARALLERLEQAGITPPHIVTALAALDGREGLLDRARQRLEAVLRAVPDTCMAQVGLARVLDRLGDSESATGMLRDLHARHPAMEEFARMLRARELRLDAEGEVAAGRPREALAKFVEALRLDAEDPYTQNGLGVVLYTLGDSTRARQAFERALALAPGLEEARSNLKALDNAVS